MLKKIQVKEYALGPKKANIVKYKKVTCLRCDKTFMGRINIRVCDVCKGLKSYKYGSIFDSVGSEMVGGI